ncbi:RluA family pseudouridine synthase [Nitrosophilus labii]|uniref:RluA family pseudouridine synthase n=1 Tax=Nitrosophilus labii TaxID=2706014 RepID=UPI0018D97468|nr:RluA family pseudouridine synthase [Nitrosophilus labii]
MAFVFKRFFVEKEIKLFLYLMKNLGITQGQAQKMIDTKKIYQNGLPITDKKATVKGELDILIFEPSTKGLKPIFKTKDFAIFDKPSGVIVHPRNRKTSYSILDEARKCFGKDANVIHRIDMETSGLLLVSANKKAEKYLKQSFEDKRVKKGYLALTKGKISNNLFIDAPIKKNRDFSKIRLKVLIDPKGKPAQTIIKPIRYYPSINATLVEAIPLTGRQHQIRAHLFHVKHPIVGDPIYGVSTEIAIRYLDRLMDERERIETTGHKRLMLHAKWLEFDFMETVYKIYSKIDFEKEINKIINRHR